MSIGQRVKRYIVMFAGIYCISLGVALLTKSSLGTSAISVIPYTLSIPLTQLSYGTWVALFNAALVVAQIFMARERNWFDLIQQFVLCLFFGSFVDVAMLTLSAWTPQAYALRFATLLAGVCVLAFGAYLTLISHVGVMAGDGFSRALAGVLHREFGTARVISDSTMAATAALLNFALFGQLVSVREGTVVSAVCTGLVVGFYSKHLKAFEYALLPGNRAEAEEQAAASAAVPEGNFVVTIAREYGSGGREIGRAIADRLGVRFYDGEIIARMTAQGFSGDEVAAYEERLRTGSALEAFYRAYAGGEAVSEEDLPEAERLFRAQERVIREIAAEGDCVIVGRLANWILRGRANTLCLFVRGDIDDKVAHVVERDGVPREAAQAMIEKVNRERAGHCRFCTGTAWDDSRNYDVTVNSSRYGIERTGEILASLAEAARA